MVLQSVVLFPMISYILDRKTLTRNQKLGYVFSIVFVLICVVGAYEVSHSPENLFQVLGVPRSANSSEIKQAYRKLSIKLHPDKNPTEEAHERFLLVTKAQNALLNEETKHAYDRWGNLGLKWVETSQDVKVLGLINFAIVALVQCIRVFILTTGLGRTNARSYSYALLGLVLAISMSLRFGEEEDIPVPFAPSMTRHEKCELLDDFMGFVIIAIGAWQKSMYEDWEDQFVKRLEIIESQQRIILEDLTSTTTTTTTPTPTPVTPATAPTPPGPKKTFKCSDISIFWVYLFVFIVTGYLLGDEFSLEEI